MGTRVRFFSIFLIVSILLAGCGVAIPSSAPELQPCQNYQNIINPYTETPEQWISWIYAQAGGATSSNPTELYKQARNLAYKELGLQTFRWSSFLDWTLPDTSRVRVTVTFLSPQLLHIILINQYLKNDATQYTTEKLNEMMKLDLNKIIQRNELFFWVTVTSSPPVNGPITNSPISIDFPALSMEITNSSNQTIIPSHADHTLSEHTHLLHSYFSGYISYPVAYQNDDGTCSLFLDSVWDTKISIGIPQLKINDEPKDLQSWAIWYEPLLDNHLGPILDLNSTTPMLDLSMLIPKSIPPNPSQVPPEPDNSYWEQLGQYIWAQLTFSDMP